MPSSKLLVLPSVLGLPCLAAAFLQSLLSHNVWSPCIFAVPSYKDTHHIAFRAHPTPGCYQLTSLITSVMILFPNKVEF